MRNARLVLPATFVVGAVLGCADDATRTPPRSTPDLAPIATPPSEESALELNNRAVGLLRSGMELEGAGRPADAANEYAAALGVAQRAVARSEGSASGRGYAIGWANMAYCLWKLGRIEEASLAGREVLRINPSYSLDNRFLKALRDGGHPVSVSSEGAGR
jgi:tetratricopeptide (TPR) repeat protein